MRRAGEQTILYFENQTLRERCPQGLFAVKAQTGAMPDMPFAGILKIFKLSIDKRAAIGYTLLVS